MLVYGLAGSPQDTGVYMDLNPVDAVRKLEYEILRQAKIQALKEMAAMLLSRLATLDSDHADAYVSAANMIG